MLQHLHIKNYAIIDEIGISFINGLNVITGETGAGKSILMGALSLILGERADTSVLLDKEKKCFIEGSFKTDHELVKKFLQENDLEAADESLIRREIGINGKSRAFVNDTPVNLNLLKGLCSLLVDLHQQFDTADIGDNNFQRQVIDALSGHSNELRQYQLLFKKYVIERKQLEELKQQQANANKEFDYQNFLYHELEEAGFVENELEEGESALKTLNNAENIKSTLTAVYTALHETEKPLIQQIKSLTNQLSALKNFHPGITGLTERLHSSQVELQDIADELDHLNNGVTFSEERINSLNERLALGYRL
ncbi:MAG: AAA family ATPase, partial [Ginsengibacter sp.]